MILRNFTEKTCESHLDRHMGLGTTDVCEEMCVFTGRYRLFTRG